MTIERMNTELEKIEKFNGLDEGLEEKKQGVQEEGKEAIK